MVKIVKEEILAGNTFQTVVGIQNEFNVEGDAVELYSRLRKVNPSPFMYYLKFGKTKIIGASPELLFGMRQKEMQTFPLAGTIKRGNTAREDLELAKILLNDKKEIAEHKMLVDLHRNDLGRVSRFGSVKVRNFMDVKRFSHVQHISSEVVGLLHPRDDVFSALASVFPAGTLTGAPKIESMKIIDRLEKYPRGPYGGALGHFGFNGDGTFAIPIRTIFINGNYGFTQAGSGIVADSSAEAEFDEIARKLAPMKEVLV
jgi:anthranilate synthase component 1